MPEEPRLLVIEGEDAGETIPVSRSPFLIGRMPSCDVVLPKKYISRKHVELLRQGGTWLVRGLSRKNPILVNRERTEQKRLSPGDRITICDVELEFRLPGVGEEGSGAGDADGTDEETRWTLPPPEEVGSGDEVGPGSGIDDPVFDDSLPDLVIREEDDDAEPWEYPDDALAGEPDGEEPASRVEEEAPEDPSDQFVFAPDEEDPSRVEDPPDDERVVFDPDSEEDAGAGGGEDRYVFAPDGEEEAPARTMVAGGDETEDALPIGDGEPPSDDLERTSFVDMEELVEARERATSPEEEQRFLKGIVGVAAVGTLIALLSWMSWSPQPETFTQPDERIAVGETIRIVDIWPDESPAVAVHLEAGGPGGIVRRTSSSWVIDSEPRVRLEWVLPTYGGRSYLVVTGREEGTGRIVVEYANDDSTLYPLRVAGDAPDRREMDSFREEMARLSVEEGVRRGRELVERGDQLWERRNDAGREDNYWRALVAYRKARIVAESIEEKLSGFHEGFNALREDAQQRLRRTEEARDAEYEQRLDQLRSSLQQDDAGRAETLHGLLLRIVNDRNDPRYEKLKIYEELLLR